jgi:exodeoxyribonuclease V beta subunit
LEEDRRLDRDEGADPAHESPAPSLLPAGTQSGTALHSLLEKLDFAWAAQTPDPGVFFEMSEIQSEIRRQIERHGLPEVSAPEIASLLWHSLRMRIPDPSGGPAFRLADIPERRAEVEFLLRLSGTPESVPEETGARNGFLWGFIDLVFRQGGRYYLLDWKSNRLDRYDDESVAASMSEHRYALQYQLYAVALDRWLRKSLRGYDPDAHFGGVFYLYLRGAPEAAAGSRFSGFAFRPSPRELREEYPRILRKTLGLA